MQNWHAYQQYAHDVVRERLAEAERDQMVRLAHRARRERGEPPALTWPRQLVWAAGSALVAVGERLVALAHAYDLRDTRWSPNTKSYAGG